MITIGIQFGGPEQWGSLVQSKLSAALNIAANTRAPDYNDGAEAWINPIFILPGSISKPDFEGYKLGHFSRKQKGLVVMIAVPESLINGENIDEFIIISLRESVGLAAAYFTSKGVSFSTLKAEKIILAIEAGLKTVSKV